MQSVQRSVQQRTTLRRVAVGICKKKYASKASPTAKPSEFAHHLGISSGKLPKNYFEDHPESKKQLLEWTRAQMKMLDNSGWYQTGSGQLARHDASMARLLRLYNDSLYEMLKDNYPDHDWQPWKFQIGPRSQWTSQRDRRRFFDWLFQELNLTNLEDWYKISSKQISESGGQQLLIHFRGNMFDALSDAYPEHKFLPWRFAQVRKGFWKDQTSLRGFLDWAAPHLGINKIEDWYTITPSKLINLGGASIFNEYGSMFEVASKAFPEHRWLEWLFEFVPRGFWSNVANVRRYFDWLRLEDLPSRYPPASSPSDADDGENSLDLLYRITHEDLTRTGGLHMVQKTYRGSLIAALRAAYPHRPWHEFQFHKARNDTWSTLKKQRDFLESVVAPQLGVKTESDWYGVTTAQLGSISGGKSLLSKYHDSPSKLFTSIFPEHNWELWRFTPAPHKYWTTQLARGDDAPLRALFTTKVGPALGVTRLEDWIRISGRDLRSQGVEGIVTLYGGFHSVLTRCFPDHNWDKVQAKRGKKLSFSKKSAQWRLKQALEQLFPNFAIQEDVEQGPASSAKVDLLVPEIGLAVEFLGEHHYRDLLNKVGLAESKTADDALKAVRLASSNSNTGSTISTNNNSSATTATSPITAIVYVPYWWDGRASSLANSIRAVRPDLFPDPIGDGQPIPDEQQQEQQQQLLSGGK